MGRKSKVKSASKVDEKHVPVNRKKRGRRKVNNFIPEMADPSIRLIGAEASIFNEKIHSHAAYQLCSEHGLTNKQLARVFGIGFSTIGNWIKNSPAFKASLQEGKDHFDSNNVEQMLLKRAMGFEYVEKEVKTIKLRGTKDGATVYVPASETKLTTKYIVPETKAAQFWLTNRNQERWQMIRKLEIESKITKEEITVNTADLKNMSLKQLQALRGMIVESAEGDGTVIPIECKSGDDEDRKLLEHFAKEGLAVIEADFDEEEEETEAEADA